MSNQIGIQKLQKHKKGLTPKEKWNRGKVRYNQQRREKYWTDENREEKLQKRKEKYSFDKEKPLIERKEKGLIWKDCFNIQKCQELGVAPLSKIWKYSTSSKAATILRDWQEKQEQEWKNGGYNFDSSIKIALENLTPENLLKTTKSQKRLATKKRVKVSDKKPPPYNPPYYLLKEDLLKINPKKKEKGVVESKKVSNKNLPIVESPLTYQETKLFKQITGMLNSPMAKVRVGVDKYGSLWWNKNWPKLFVKEDINELMKENVINWKIPTEDGLPKWVKCKLVLGIQGGVKVKWEGKWYWLYVIDHDFWKDHIPSKLQQRLRINTFKAMEVMGCWYNETEHGLHHYILSEANWPNNVKLLWKDRFNQYFEAGDVIQKGRCALFNKTFNLGKGKMTVVKDFKGIQSLYKPFYAELIAKEEIIKNKLKIKLYQNPQTLLKNKEKELNEPVLNDVNENNSCLMTKMLEYIQERLKQKNSYVVKTQPQIFWSGKSRRGFYLMKIRNLLTNQEMWVYLPMLGYEYGVSGRQKPNIYKGGVFNFTLNQGHSLTFITNYTTC